MVVNLKDWPQWLLFDLWGVCNCSCKIWAFYFSCRKPHFKHLHLLLLLLSKKRKQGGKTSEANSESFTAPLPKFKSPEKNSPRLWINFYFFAYEAPSNVNTTLDGSTYLRWKMCHFSLVIFFSCKSKHIRLHSGPVLPPTTWWSLIITILLDPKFARLRSWVPIPLEADPVIPFLILSSQ